MVLGPVVERVLRLIYHRDEHFQLLLTFAFVLMFEDIIRMIWGASPRQTENIYQVFGEIHLSSGMTIPAYNLIVIAVAIAFSLVLGWFLQSTRFGKIVRATAENAAMCEALCIDVSKVYMVVFTLGVALGTTGGALVVPATAASLDMGVELIVDAFAVVVIGGLGSMPGALVGALIVGFVRAAAISIYPEFEVLAIYVLVIAVLILRPRGSAREGNMSAVNTAARQTAARNPAEIQHTQCPAIGFALIAVFPYLAGPHYTILMFSAMGFAIALFGLNLLFGYTGLLPFGHAMFLATGAYTAAYLTAAKYLSLELILLTAAVAAIAIAIPVGLLCIRYIKIYFGMLTLAFSMLLYSFLFKFYQITGGDEGLRIKMPTPSLFDLSKLDTVAILTGPLYYYVFGLMLVLAFIMWRIVDSNFRPRSARDPRERAEGQISRRQCPALPAGRLRDRRRLRGARRRYCRHSGRACGPKPRLLGAVRQSRVHAAARRLHQFLRPGAGCGPVHFLPGPVDVLHRILAAYVRRIACGHRDLFSERADGNRRSATLVVDMTLLQASACQEILRRVLRARRREPFNRRG